LKPALNTGQLVKDEYFTLFESVAALEVRVDDTGRANGQLQLKWNN